MGCPPARVGGSVEVFEYLSPKVSGYQRIWRRAMSLRSRGDLSAMAAQTHSAPEAAPAAVWRDSASATTFAVPGRCTSWLVYSEMKAGEVELLAARGRR